MLGFFVDGGCAQMKKSNDGDAGLEQDWHFSHLYIVDLVL